MPLVAGQRQGVNSSPMAGNASPLELAGIPSPCGGLAAISRAN